MSTDPHHGDTVGTVRRGHGAAASEAGPHPALITSYDSTPTLTLVLPPHLGKDEVLAGLARAIGQTRAGLARRARQFQHHVEEYAAAGDQLRQALCRGQVLASSDAASHLDEDIVEAFDLWPQYEAQTAAQTLATAGGQASVAVAAFPGQEPAASPAGWPDSPAAEAGLTSPPQAGEEIMPYIEAADEETLRRALRAVAGQLGDLRQAAVASHALSESAKAAADSQHTAALEADDAGSADADQLTAAAVQAYATSVGFGAGAFHIGYCINAVTAALTGGLGLTGPPSDQAAWEDPLPPGQVGHE